MRFIRKGGRVIPIRDNQPSKASRVVGTAGKAAAIGGGAAMVGGGVQTVVNNRKAVHHALKGAEAHGEMRLAKMYGDHWTKKTGEYVGHVAEGRKAFAKAKAGAKIVSKGINYVAGGALLIAASKLMGRKKKDG